MTSAVTKGGPTFPFFPLFFFFFYRGRFAVSGTMNDERLPQRRIGKREGKRRETIKRGNGVHVYVFGEFPFFLSICVYIYLKKKKKKKKKKRKYKRKKTKKNRRRCGCGRFRSGPFPSQPTRLLRNNTDY